MEGGLTSLFNPTDNRRIYANVIVFTFRGPSNSRNQNEFLWQVETLQ